MNNKHYGSHTARRQNGDVSRSNTEPPSTSHSPDEREIPKARTPEIAQSRIDNCVTGRMVIDAAHDSDDDISIHVSMEQVLKANPKFILVEPSWFNEASSSTIVIEENSKLMATSIHKKYFIKHILSENLADIPYTNCKSTDYVILDGELEVKDINLLDEDEIDIDEIDVEKSVVVDYIRNRNVIDSQAELQVVKKKESILLSVPKMETIPEDQEFIAFPEELSRSISTILEDVKDDSNDAHSSP